MSAMLEIGSTLAAAEVRHRLALGLTLVDALSGFGALGPLRVDVDRIGPYAFPKRVGSDRQPMRFDVHRADRHAKRYCGRARKLLDLAMADGADTRWLVRIYGSLGPADLAYAPARDARLYVPRRLRIELDLDAQGQPAATEKNIRTPWLWPGAAYPLPSSGTIVRGRVRRGADIDSAVPIRWARAFLTMPQSEADFAKAKVVGRGHGDEQGEFVISLERSAVVGAALSNPLSLRLWAFFPPPSTPADAADPLDGLPVEEAGSDIVNDVLRGYELPAGYTQQASKPVSIRLGETKSGLETTLLFS
jgi:hypothetical protein